MRLSDEELVRELRAIRPEPNNAFAAELDAWAAEGFPSARRIERRDDAEADAESPGGMRERFRRWREGRPMLPVLAGAATIVLAVSVSVGVFSNLGSGGQDDGGVPLSAEAPGSGRSAQGQIGESSGPAGDSPASSGTIEPAPITVPPVPAGDARLKPGAPRQVERTASMALSTEPGDVAEVADGVVEVTERYDGIVVSSQVNTAAERGRASFDLRIPSQNLQATLADLSDLASVSSRNEGTLDITAPFVSAEERFDDAKAEADALVARLAEGGSADEIASLRAQLQTARVELAAARSDLASLKQRGNFSKLAVTVSGDGDSGGWSIGDAVDDAGSVLEDIGGATIVALAVIVPLGILGAGLWFGLRAVRRRARESALDD